LLILKEYAPFDQLTFQELSDTLVYPRSKPGKKQNVIQFNDVLHDSFYVVASEVHLSVIADAEETILNKCHEGAILVCVLFRKTIIE
jgi:CBS domain-containing protein